MSIIIRVVIILACAYAGSVVGSVQSADLPDAYKMAQK